MGSVFWHLANRTAETQFIFNLFHLLLAGLTLLVLLHQQRTNRGATTRDPNRLLAAGFLLLVLHFALHTLYFGAEFFFRTELAWAGFQSFSHGLLVWGLLTVVAFHRPGELRRGHRVVSWAIPAGILVGGLVLADILFASPQLVSEGYPHSLPVLLLDLLALGGVGFGMRAVWRRRQEGTTAALAALASFGLVFLLHSAPFFVTPSIGISLWNLEQNLLSVSLFAFAWAAGERSRNLLDRVFVRLNLTFIILASLIMLITVGMEKYQYLRLAEERSMNLAEFLRGHVVYYKAQGYGLEDIFRRPEVLRRVVVEFGTVRFDYRVSNVLYELLNIGRRRSVAIDNKVRVFFGDFCAPDFKSLETRRFDQACRMIVRWITKDRATARQAKRLRLLAAFQHLAKRIHACRRIRVETQDRFKKPLIRRTPDTPIPHRVFTRRALVNLARSIDGSNGLNPLPGFTAMCAGVHRERTAHRAWNTGEKL